MNLNLPNQSTSYGVSLNLKQKEAGVQVEDLTTKDSTPILEKAEEISCLKCWHKQGEAVTSEALGLH